MLKSLSALLRSTLGCLTDPSSWVQVCDTEAPGAQGGRGSWKDVKNICRATATHPGARRSSLVGLCLPLVPVFVASIPALAQLWRVMRILT